MDSNFHEIKSYEKEDALNHFLNPDEDVEIVEIDANKIFNIIYGNIEYAENLGFEPDKSFKITEYILDAADTIDYVEVEFGDNGTPTLIAENEDNLDAICAVLDKSVGSDGYKVTYDDYESEPDFINDSRGRFISHYAYSKYS